MKISRFETIFNNALNDNISKINLNKKQLSHKQKLVVQQVFNEALEYISRVKINNVQLIKMIFFSRIDALVSHDETVQSVWIRGQMAQCAKKAFEFAMEEVFKHAKCKQPPLN